MDKASLPAAYSYTQLPSERWIRLLKIVPNPSCQHGFSLRLTEHSLADIPPFWALSYTWGSSDFPEDDREDATSEDRVFHVNCDGQDVEVGESLFDFLQQMNEDISRSQADSRSTRAAAGRLVVPDRRTYFWIDAICINQQDPDERSQQVQLMGDLYQCASQVVAWLGKTEPNENVHWVLETFAPLMASLVRPKSEGIRILARAGHQLDHPDAVALVGGDEFCWRWRSSYTDYFAFFARKRWLTRGWVVQEAAIPAPDDVVLRCGKSQLSWLVVNELSEFFLAVGWDYSLNAQLEATLPGWKKRPGTLDRLWNPISISLPEFQQEKICESMVKWQDLRWGAVTDEEVRYAEVLHTFHRLRIYEFGNPLDRIYGALGLIHRILGPNHKLGIVPSYDVPVGQAFADVAAWLLRHLPNLDILGLAGLAEGRRELLPSWVPDFTFLGPIHYTSLQRARQLFKSSRWSRPLHATRTAVNWSRPFAQIKGSELTLEGTCFDKINTSRRLRCDDQGVLSDVSWIFDFCDRDGAYGPTNETFAEVIVKTLSAGVTHGKITHGDYRDVSWIPDKDVSWTPDFCDRDGASVPKNDTFAKEVGGYRDRCESWVRDCIVYNWLSNRGDAVLDISARLEAGSAGSTRAKDPFMTVDGALLEASRDGFGSSLTDDPITETIHFIAPGRQILETDGSYLGLGPAEMQPGDEVWLLKGGRMPLLLRKTEASLGPGGDAVETNRDTYVLVGEVYLHGIMNGEAMTNELSERFQQVVIV